MSRYPDEKTNIEKRYKDDSYVQQAVEDLKEWFNDNREERIGYMRQLAVIFEDDYYHWITYNAIKYLHKQGFLKKDQRKWGKDKSLNIFYTPEIKYKSRKEKKIINIVQTLDENSREIGDTGEYVVERTLGRMTNMDWVGKETRSYDGKEWTDTDENLDLIYEYNDVGIGIEVKNRLSYPEKQTILNKIKICNHLGLKPVFICRMMPYERQNILNKQDGFGLRFKRLILPNHLTGFENDLRDIMHIPASSDDVLDEKAVKVFKDHFISEL